MDFFHTLVYQPIYNALVFLVGLIPGGDIGFAIIALTLLVRLCLFPLSATAIRTQISMRALDPKLKELKEKLKDDKEALGRETMQLFKENKVNPFASFFLVLIQLPIIIGLYSVLRVESHGISFDPTLLYSFVHAPEHVSSIFLGFIDMSGRSILLALIVAGTQFLFARLMVTAQSKAKPGAAASFQDDLQKSMSVQMQYVFPLVLGVVAYAATSAIALYFVVSNTFSIGQELFVRKIHNVKR